MAKKTKRPKGLKITRDGPKFTFSWTAKDKYVDVDIHYKIDGKPKGKKWHKDRCGKDDLKNSKRTLTITSAKKSVTFTVRGKAKDKKESEWAKAVTYTIELPKKPGISATLNTNVENQTTFSWSVPSADNASRYWYFRYIWRIGHQWEGDKNPTWGSWNYGRYTNGSRKAGATSGSWSNPETLTLDKSFRRIVQVYSNGQRGNSGTVGAEHIYGRPALPTKLITKTAVQKASGIEIFVTWQSNHSYWHPVDQTRFQYAISPPDKGMVAPKNLSGSEISAIATKIVKDKKGNLIPYTDATSRVIDKQLQDNECLFYRLQVYHDSEERNSRWTSWVRVHQLPSKLSTPQQLTFEHQSNNVWDIEVNNTATDVPDSYLVIYYKSVVNGVENSARAVGIIPNGYTEAVPVFITDDYNPDDPETSVDAMSFGVQAIASIRTFSEVTVPNANVFNVLRHILYIKSGTQYIPVGTSVYSSTTQYYSEFPFTPGTVGPYDFVEFGLPDSTAETSMVSDQLWGEGDVPKPPTEFQVISSDDGIATASWEWTWPAASYVELAWAENSDAWESNKEPTTYRVKRYKATKWNIHDLTAGVVWYFRSRFVRVSGESENSGPWSKTFPLNLTAAPVAPVLNLSRNIVTEDQDFVASWVYTSVDGTAQQLAEIFLVSIDDHGTRRGEYVLATDHLPVNDPSFIFDSTLTYYTLESGNYVTVENPVESSLADYYMFDDKKCLAKTEQGSSVQQLTLNAKELKLALGQVYRLSLRLKSKSGVTSEWSPLVELTIVEPLAPPVIPKVTQFIPETVTEPLYDESGELIEETTRTYFALKALPFTLDIQGAGETGTTILTIERAANFFTDKPDESTDHGYEGEIVAMIRQTGEAPITIDRDTLNGYLDDTATYKITATIIDENGQTASCEYVTADVTAETYDSVKSILFTRTEEKPYEYILVDSEDSQFDPNTTYYYKNEFTVSWEHQPTKPKAVIETDNQRYAVKITPKVPEGVTPKEGDVVDIYRLSVDMPELIIADSPFNQTYVDPYPAIGEFGGHRIVYKTINGDYIYEDPEYGRQFSWIDTNDSEDEDSIEGDVDRIDTPYSIINFDDGFIEVLYNINLSSSWKKDFKETRYLGGHIQGDWNPGVSRTGSISTVSVNFMDQDTIKLMRKLADYPGICHVRTRDGSSYAANVEVSETMNYDKYDLVNYTLNITRVEPQTLDGMTLEEWNRLIEEDE